MTDPRRIVAESAEWKRAWESARAYARASSDPILFCGELGTGRRTLAGLLHRATLGSRPFVVFDCDGSAPIDLVRETGSRIRTGGHRFHENAARIEGTICLVNLDRASRELQVAVRASIVEQRSVPSRAPKSLSVDVRVLATTDMDRERFMAAIDRELAARLSTQCVEVAPLRSRREDIAPLAQIVLEDARQAGVTTTSDLPLDVTRQLVEYVWPGNIYELQSVVREFAATGRLRSLDARLPVVGARQQALAAEGTSLASMIGGLRLDDVERLAVAATLAGVDWNKAQAAKVLGISRRALYDKIERYGLSPPGGTAPGTT